MLHQTLTVWSLHHAAPPVCLLQGVTKTQGSTPLLAPSAAAQPPLIAPPALELAPPKALLRHSLATSCPKAPCHNRPMHLYLQVAHASQQPSRGSLHLAPPDPSPPLTQTPAEEQRPWLLTGHQALVFCLCHSHWDQTSWGTPAPHQALAAGLL